MSTPHDLLTDLLADQLEHLMDGAEPGHCVRIDDVDAGLADRLCLTTRTRLPGVAVRVLRATAKEDHDIVAERAIELRNRKQHACLLLVPAGEGHAASSLDNSFMRVPVLDIYQDTEGSLLERIADAQVREVVRRNKRWLRGQHREAWAEFLAELCADPSSTTLGANLWRVGLIPDRGEHPEERLELNRHAAHVISRPSRPSASIDERLTTAGLQDGPWRAPLRRFLEQRGARLANPRYWGRQIADSHPELSFDRWLFADRIVEEVEAIEVDPFIRNDGTLDRTSKLELAEGSQLILRVPEGSSAPMVVKWHTTPRRVSAVARWQLTVVPPEDLRTEETEPLATAYVTGDKERGTIRVSVDEDSLAQGSRFVVSVKAIGEHGEGISLTSGAPAEIDSQEFQIVSGADPEAKLRRSAAPSVPEAVLRAALDGLDDLSEDLISWDMAGQVFGVRLGNRRSIQVRVCEALVRMQRQATSNPAIGLHFSAETAYGTPLDEPAAHPLSLPPALRKSRMELLGALRERAPRDTAESVAWDSDLRDAARTYLATYRRALDSADRAALRDLLLLDTLSLGVRRREATVHAVVLLPIHPLRLAWVAEHDEVLRRWADELTQVMPRSARGSMLDADLVSQVVPANLPFSLIDQADRIGVYTEELTFGTGLYLVPSSIDTDAAAESVCSVLGLERTGSTLRASSRMVAERIRAYESAHDPGGALRILSVNPGSGELLAGALNSVVLPSEVTADEPVEPRRVEVIGYSDSAAYVRPVPALAELQAKARAQEVSSRANHLFPPLSLSVRPASQVLDDTARAHLAVVQDVGPATVDLATPAERQPSFRDLLVPLVTRSSTGEGELVWESLPATGVTSATAEHGLATAHRAHQRSLGRLTTGNDQAGVPAVRVVLDGESQARIGRVHERADWVVGIDRFIGVDLYEGNAAAAMTRTYLLDYAPDFVEGIGDRLTVTTANRAEVERLLDGAMRELGLADVEQSVGAVLSTLTVVSGRLALRLLEETSMAREAVSLAAVISHLRQRGALDDLIVVPVDAHPEIFGAAVRGEGTARRCDLLLIRIGPRSFKIECVEVKSRKEARLPQALADMIVNQLEDTLRVLETRFFAADPPRTDGELQRARLGSLLHYYADRSANHGLIAADRIDDIHRYIDRAAETGERAEITMRGYVISLDGDEGFKKRYGDVSLTVLTAADLGRVGFTTRVGTPPESEEVDPDGRPATLPAPATSPTDGEDIGTETAEIGEGANNSSATPAKKASEAGTGGTSDPGRTLGRASFGEEAHDDPAMPEAPSDAHAETARAADDAATDALGTTDIEEEGADADGSPAGEATVTLGQDANGAPVTWHVSTKGSPHAFVIGIPGQGKSVTTRRIIRDFADQGLPSLVFDFHGDMSANPPSGARVLNAADGLPFNPFEPDVRAGRPINTTAWEIAEVVGYVAKLGEIQRNHVYRALQAAYAACGWSGTQPGTRVPTMQEFADSVEAVETGAQGRNARARLQPFTDFGLFADDASGRFDLLNDELGGIVIDVSQLGLEEVQRFAASFILRRVYREMFAWPQDGTMKLAVVLDEAHRMARDVTLPKLMKEGRKYGVGVIVASQSADDFHADVLGNAGAKIVFRTNYPASKAVSGFLRGRSGLDLSQEIEKLDVGVAFVSTPEVARARRVYMAP
ncbi:ATP-binding protein [Actinotalea sp. AC32]|nr:ATP-binding protein [Actinotalea sp. AC32]